jgi:hypothetical protein
MLVKFRDGIIVVHKAGQTENVEKVGGGEVVCKGREGSMVVILWMWHLSLSCTHYS